jgi:hypothetical protein
MENNTTTPTAAISSNGNAMMQLSLYKSNGTWMFDDVARQIFAEPFVLGMSEIITKHIPETSTCKLLFSLQPFPGAYSLRLLREEANGGWYHAESLNMEGWLCPVTRIYCAGIPDMLYYNVH